MAKELNGVVMGLQELICEIKQKTLYIQPKEEEPKDPIVVFDSESYTPDIRELMPSLKNMLKACLCKVGIHHYNKWTEPVGKGIQVRAKKCEWCHKRKLKLA